MNKNQKNMITALIMTLGVLIIASWFINSTSPGMVSEPANFYGTSKEVSLDEMKEVADKSNFSLFLPFNLPKNLVLTAIYLKESPFIAIVVYSANNNKDYITAEFTIEIAPVNPKWIPTFDELQSEAEQSPDKTALKINTWSVMIYENADIGGNSEKRELYGDFTLLVNLWIDDIGYLYCAPTLTVNDAISIVGSMTSLNT